MKDYKEHQPKILEIWGLNYLIIKSNEVPLLNYKGIFFQVHNLNFCYYKIYYVVNTFKEDKEQNCAVCENNAYY